MGISSYTKIYKLMANTDTFLKFEEDFIKGLNEFTITEVKFSICRDYNTKLVRAAPTFFLSNGMRVTGISGWIDITRAIDQDALTIIIDKHFGNDVKTYFCKSEIVKVGGRKSNGDSQDSFYEWVTAKFQEKYADLYDETRVKVEKAILEYSKSDSFKELERAFLTEECKESIQDALKPWREMPDELLRDAFNEFLCRCIIEM